MAHHRGHVDFPPKKSSNWKFPKAENLFEERKRRERIINPHILLAAGVVILAKITGIGNLLKTGAILPRRIKENRWKIIEIDFFV